MQRKDRLFAHKQIPVKYRCLRRPSARRVWEWRNKAKVRERARELKEAAASASAVDNEIVSKPRRNMANVHFYNAATTELIKLEKSSGTWDAYKDESERMKSEDYPPDVQERLRPYLPYYMETFAKEMLQKFGTRVVVLYSYVDEEKQQVYASE